MGRGKGAGKKALPRFDAATLVDLAEMASGDALSSDEFESIRKAFPALVQAAEALGIASERDRVLIALDEEDVDNSAFNEICNRFASLTEQVARDS